MPTSGLCLLDTDQVIAPAATKSALAGASGMSSPLVHVGCRAYQRLVQLLHSATVPGELGESRRHIVAQRAPALLGGRRPRGAQRHIGLRPTDGASVRRGSTVGLPYLPITALFPLAGPVGLISLPSKWHIEFGSPIPTSGFSNSAADDPALTFELADQYASRSSRRCIDY